MRAVQHLASNADLGAGQAGAGQAGAGQAGAAQAAAGRDAPTRAVLRALQGWNFQTETLFLAAGDELVSLAAQFECVEGPMLALADLSQSESLPWLTQSLSQVEAIVQDIAGILGGGVGQFLAVSTVAHQLRSELLDMDRIVRTMTIVALNARVNVAALAARHAGLQVFSTKASELVERAAHILVNSREAITAMVEKSDTGRELAQATQAHFQRDLLNVILRLGRDMGQLQTGTKAAGQEGRDISAEAQNIREQISKVVFSLQVGDSTRQRAEHVIDAYTELSAQADPVARAALSELAAQLLESCTADHANAVTGIAQQIRDIRERSRKMLGGKAAMPIGHSATGARMQQHIQTLRHEATQSRTEQAALVAIARDLSSGLHALAEVVAGMRTVEEQMRTIGVNAVIACGSLGDEGNGLKEISVQLRELAAAMTGRFVVINEKLAEMSGVTTSVCDQLSEETRAPFEQLDMRIDEIFEALERIAATVKAADSGAVKLKDLMQREREQGSVQRLIEHSKTLGEIAQAARQAASAPSLTDLHGEMQADLADFAWLWAKCRSGYTSAQERDIHDALFGC